MASYQHIKSKKFYLKKEAKEWLREFKKDNNIGEEKYKVDVNFHPDDPQPWEAVIMRKV